MYLANPLAVSFTRSHLRSEVGLHSELVVTLWKAGMHRAARLWLSEVSQSGPDFLFTTSTGYG